MYDSIIIGAGMSGLAAGIRAAYYDQKVCVLERHYTIGGLNSFYRLRGRNYDVGLHAVTNFTPPGAKRGPFARLLRQLRMKWDDFGLSPQEAIDAPRCFSDDGVLKVERGYAPEVVKKLSDMGHQVTQATDAIGGSQAIYIHENGVLEGASDPRKDGCAIGY